MPLKWSGADLVQEAEDEGVEAVLAFIARIVLRDPEAQHALHLHCVDSMARVIARKASKRGEPWREDVLQDALIILYEKLEQGAFQANHEGRRVRILHYANGIARFNTLSALKGKVVDANSISMEVILEKELAEAPENEAGSARVAFKEAYTYEQLRRLFALAPWTPAKRTGSCDDVIPALSSLHLSIMSHCFGGAKSPGAVSEVLGIPLERVLTLRGEVLMAAAPHLLEHGGWPAYRDGLPEAEAFLELRLLGMLLVRLVGEVRVGERQHLRLTERERECFEWYYVHELNHLEVAEKMETTRGNVDTLLNQIGDKSRRALPYVRRHLEGQGL